MAKLIDEEELRKVSKTPVIPKHVEFDVKVVMVSPLEKDLTLEATNSNVIVVSNPESPKLAPGMSIVAEDGGFEKEEKKNTKTTRGRSKSGASREIGDR